MVKRNKYEIFGIFVNIKVAAVDDHDLFREGLRLVLSQIEGFEVVYDSSDGNKFLENLDTTTPDVVLMDISMPIIDGIETTKLALRKNPNLKIIALTMFSDKLHYMQMIHAGVKGFVQKKATKYELELAIRTVYNGGNYFSQEILQKMAFQSSNFSSNPDQLSIRECDVLNLVCTGFTSQEISEKLFISPKTVEVHRTNIFQKAGVHNVAELIIWAVKNNYFAIE